jgi:hypothetical protein
MINEMTYIYQNIRISYLNQNLKNYKQGSLIFKNLKLLHYTEKRNGPNLK